MPLRTKLRSFLFTLVFPLLLFINLSASCSKNSVSEEEKNLARAHKIYNRVAVGMSEEDGCWYMGTSYDPQKTFVSHQMDVGTSFSKKEFQVGMYIQQGRVVRVEIVKPHYEGKVRTSNPGKLIAEKGVSLNEALGTVSAGATNP